jgi:hypothetical protein
MRLSSDGRDPTLSRLSSPGRQLLADFTVRKNRQAALRPQSPIEFFFCLICHGQGRAQSAGFGTDGLAQNLYSFSVCRKN